MTKPSYSSGFTRGRGRAAVTAILVGSLIVVVWLMWRRSNDKETPPLDWEL